MKLLVLLTEPADAASVINTLGRQLEVVDAGAAMELIVVSPRYDRELLPGPHVTLSLKTLSGVRSFRRLLRSFAPDCVYARGPLAGAFVVAAQWSGDMILDIRGLPVAENQAIGGSTRRGLVLRMSERISIRRATRIQTVSLGLAVLLRQRNQKVPVSVVPNGVSYSRHPLSIPKEGPSVIFSGGADAWQSPEAILTRLRRFQDAGIDTCVYTHNPDFGAAARAVGLRADAVSPDEALAIYSNATALVIPRADTLVNRVASPIKVGEALASGVGLLTTPYSSEALSFLARGVDWLPWDAPETQVSGWLHRRHADLGARQQTRDRASSYFDLDRFAGELDWFFGTGSSRLDGSSSRGVR